MALNGAYILDKVNAIGSQGPQITAATDALYAKTKLQLYVVYVASFSGVTDKTKWANATAQANGLGANDILLAVATVDHNYSIFYGRSSALTASKTSAVEQDDIIPVLKKGNWAGAAIAAATGYESAASGGTAGSGTAGSGTAGNGTAGNGAGSIGETTTGGSGSALPILFIVIILALIVVGIIFYSRSRRRRGAASALPQPVGPTQQELDQRCGSLLVQLDDSLKTSAQELDFAIAEFGSEATSPFSTALANAQAQVKEAFALRQRLDDAIPETAEEKRTMATRIIELCEAADRELDEQADAFHGLRELEKTAPDALRSVVSAAETAKSRLSAARATLASLTLLYSPAALSAVAGNPDQVEKLLEFVGAAGATADVAITSGDSGRAAVNVRAAQASVGQTTQLLDSIDTLATNLADARSNLDAAIIDTRADLVAAKALTSGNPASLAEPIAAAESALAAATSQDAHRDPLASLAVISTANARLDQVLDAARDEQQKATSATAQLATAMSTASSQIATASDFITTRRGAVGSTARTRVSEATRRLDTAMSIATSNPVQALAEANAAQALAANALSLAQDDVGSSNGGFGGMAGGGMGGGNLLGGAIIGGIIGGLFSGGGGFGGGYGGGGYGAGFGGGGFDDDGSSRNSGGSFGDSDSFGASSDGDGYSDGGGF